MNKVNFDDYTEDYNELLHKETGFFSPDEAYFARYKVQIARDQVSGEPRRVLEFGCGIGRNIPFLREAFSGAEIMGSDISAKSLDVARNENKGVFFWEEGDKEHEQGGFDLIFVAGVFHHIPPAERLTAARSIFARLIPGGSVIVFEHNPYNPLTRRIVSNCPYDEDAVLLTPGELYSTLQKGGMRVQGRGYSLFFPPRFKVLLVLERVMGWLPLGGQYWMRALRP